MVVVDEAEFRGLPGMIAIHRAAIALALGNVADTVKYARAALDLVPADDHHRRGSAAGFLGLAYWTRGSRPRTGHMQNAWLWCRGWAHL